MKDASRVRILVVDDEPDVSEVMKALLTTEGYSVTALNDPTQVAKTMSDREFHLVVLDMMMPTLSGEDVLKIIREQDDDVAVIVATAHPTVDNALASLKATAADYIKKPFEPKAFVAAVNTALTKKGISQDPEAELHRNIGRAIREGRTRQNLTLKQLARRTGLSVSLLSQIERAESSASISSLYRISGALKVRMSELFGAA